MAKSPHANWPGQKFCNHYLEIYSRGKLTVSEWLNAPKRNKYLFKIISLVKQILYDRI